MRLIRKLRFGLIRKQKWKLLSAFLLVLTIYSLTRQIVFTPIRNSSVCEPIDLVYTWVNGSDPVFISSIQEYYQRFDISRFDDKNELKYSLRSVDKFAPWVRNIYIVTNGQIPKWLDLSNERVTIVPHEVLAPNSQWLPTFSSAAIETFIHRIPNLSKRFIYLNDDIFLGTELYPEDLYTDSEGVKIYQAWLVPDCAEDCPWTYIGDGACDRHCNIEVCQYDGGDCSDEFNEYREDNKSNEHFQDNSARKISTKIGIKEFPKRYNLIHQAYYNQNISFKTHILQHKNLTSAGDLKLVVDDFNKKQQVKLHAKRQHESIVREKLIKSKSTIPSKDIYSQSLIYTNILLNRWYGFKARNVLSHVGFLLEKHIIEDMLEKFKKEFIITARNRFRAPNDIQYAFAYYSFVMEETNRVTIREIFNDFDTDHSMTWSDREIRTFLAKIFQLPLDWSAVRFFEDVIQNCSIVQNLDNNINKFRYTTNIYERYEDSNLPTVTRDLIERCAPLAEALEDNFAIRRKYKYHINPKKYIRNNFMMLTSNVTDVVNALDKIRRNPRKFNCINDNLDPKLLEENELIRHLLEDFYISLFPHRSQFELLPQYRNRFDNWKDYLKWRRQQRAILIIMYGLSIFILIYLIRSICIHKAKFVSRCVQKL